MSRPRQRRSDDVAEPPTGMYQLAVAVLPSVAVMVILLFAATTPGLAPKGLFGAPLELLGFVLVGAVAALHRPLRDLPIPAARSHLNLPILSLGLGTLVLPALALRQGPVVAAICASLILIGSEAVFRFASRRLQADEAHPRWLPSLEGAALVSIVALLAAVAMGQLPSRQVAPAGSAAWIWVGAGVYVLSQAVIVLGLARMRGGALRAPTQRGDAGRLDSGATLSSRGASGWPGAVSPSSAWARSAPVRRILAPLLLDTLGWLLGGLLAGLALAVGWREIIWLWPVLALAFAESARQALLRGRADLRLGSFERLQEAHERILSETSGMGGIAQQVLVECRNILPVQWFQFELPEAEGHWQSWAAGPDGLLVEGSPKPPLRPDMLPGIHRSAEWEILERSLVKSEDGAEEVLARLRLWCDPRRIEAGAVDLFGTLLPQMASSVHRARLDQEAKLDPLTGVPVRRVLESRLQRAFKETCEEGQSLAVIMCDIDFFKKVNDTYGHLAGDEALKAVAAALEGARREGDLCCRYGGEEFTVLLEKTDGTDALRLAERLRRAVEALRFAFEGQAIPLTLSLGVAAFPELHVKTASEILLLADEALYAAKEGGRNQCLLNVGRGAYRPI